MYIKLVTYRSYCRTPQRFSKNVSMLIYKENRGSFDDAQEDLFSEVVAVEMERPTKKNRNKLSST